MRVALSEVLGARSYALLLKDAGCSSTAADFSRLFAADDHEAKRAMKLIDWSRPGALAHYTVRNVAPGAGPLAKARQLHRITQEKEITSGMVGRRCERGADIARMLDLPDATQEAIRSLDEHWNGAGRPAGLRDEEIPVLGRILCLAQTVEVFVRTVGLAGALEMAVNRRGSWFDPSLVDALLAVRDDRRLWGPLADPRAVPSLAVWEPADRIRTAGDDELDRIAEAFARVIDAKSPYTAQHSSGVADWAVAAGTVVGLPPDELRDLRRAGLLHDIGKLAVSSRILDKPGKLGADEFAAMREHPRYTMQILERVACFRGIVEVAASHHERLDGTGYHRGLPGHELSRSARLLAVADVYEALTADRPYRAAMPRERALSILHEQRGTGLCPAAVDALEAAATGTTPWTAALRPEGSDPSGTSIGQVVVSVRLFAGLRERAGAERLQLELPDGARVADVLAAMADTPVGAVGPRECVVALNREYADADALVQAGDEVALVPPVSGGAGPVRRVRVTGDALDLSALADAVRDPRAGAVVVFEGVTREVPELEYEAYAEMAEPRIEAIAGEEAERHGLCGVAVEHRSGTVALSEPSVIVAASAPHRGEAFAGARAIIDRVKAEAPIWKVEVTAGGRRRAEGTLPPT